MLSLKINKNTGVLRKGFAVRELAVLPEDLDLIPTQTWWETIIHNSSQGIQHTLLATKGTRHTCDAQTYAHQTPMHILIFIFKLKIWKQKQEILQQLSL